MPLALAVSALLHLLFFVVLRFEATIPRPPASGAPAVVSEPEGLRIVEIVPVPDEALPEVEAPEPEEEPIVPRAVRPPAGAPTVVQPPAGERRDPAATVAERVSPRMGDARLFEEHDPLIPLVVDREALAIARLYALMEAYNDSTGAAAEAAARALDWTVQDGNGGRWGISPGRIHLGGISLPLPISFAPPPGRRDAIAARNRTFGEIAGQRARAEGNASFEERVKAIRERMDAQRDSARRSGTGGRSR
jgi:hypothetical protein